MARRVLKFASRAVPSWPPVSSRGFSAAHATARMGVPRLCHPWPWNTWEQAPVLGSHTRTQPSSEAVTTRLPWAANMPAVTGPSWPANTCMQAPVDASHIQDV